MPNREPMIVVKGLEDIIRKDLKKHQTLLERSKAELDAFRLAVSYQVKKKKYYKSLLGGGKYNDESLRKSMDMIVIDLRHMSDKVKLSEEAIAHHKLIVDTLSAQLEDQYKRLEMLVTHKRKEKMLNAVNN